MQRGIMEGQGEVTIALCKGGPAQLEKEAINGSACLKKMERENIKVLSLPEHQVLQPTDKGMEVHVG